MTTPTDAFAMESAFLSTLPSFPPTSIEDQQSLFKSDDFHTPPPIPMAIDSSSTPSKDARSTPASPFPNCDNFISLADYSQPLNHYGREIKLSVTYTDTLIGLHVLDDEKVRSAKRISEWALGNFEEPARSESASPNYDCLETIPIRTSSWSGLPEETRTIDFSTYVSFEATQLNLYFVPKESPDEATAMTLKYEKGVDTIHFPIFC